MLVTLARRTATLRVPFPMTDRLTIMIAARNAAATIERAVRSCAGESRVPLLLIDDHSTDDTVALARTASGGDLRVVSTPDPGGVSTARQAGLDAVATEFAAWLDADDEWVRGRTTGLVGRLGEGCDVAVDQLDLIDGATGAWLRRLAAPDFVRTSHGPLRLFERNWLPGDSQVAFRVSRFRAAGGYDPGIYGPESYDVLLRSIAAGAAFGWRDSVGYRMHAYPHSVSRHIARQRGALAVVLRKHAYASVSEQYRTAGYCERVTAWALVSMALFRGEPDAALRFLDEASPASAVPGEILEPDGPWPFREGWRRAFARGTALLLLGGQDAAALDAFRLAQSIEPTAEGANNLGVALARTGSLPEAHECWEHARRGFPGYADPRLNAAAPDAGAITTHPLRRHPSRHDYPHV